MKFFTISVCIKALSQVMQFVIESFVNYIMKTLIAGISIAIQAIFITPWVNIAWPLLQNAMENLNQQSLNPIVNLGNMGITIINYLMLLYIAMITAFLGTLAFPLTMIFVAIVTFIMLPIIASFFAIMVSISFICSYYVPLLPYMIFTFGTLSWFMAVIEAMVAGPIVALGVMSPEGEGILGKAEHGMMILVNVFLRPAMMVIGFVLGSILTYVFVWVLAEGYQRASEFLKFGKDSMTGLATQSSTAQTVGFKYTTGIFGMLYASLAYVVIYISLYMTVVEKSFDLIHQLPDQILRWIGGHPESYGREAKEWTQAAKEKTQKLEEGATKSVAASAQSLEGVKKDVVARKKEISEALGLGGGGTGGEGG